MCDFLILFRQYNAPVLFNLWTNSLNLQCGLGTFVSIREGELIIHVSILLPHFQQHYKTVIFGKHIDLAIRMTKIYFSHIFGLYPQFLAHSSPNPSNFLSCRSNGASFVTISVLLSSVPEKASEP